MDHDSRDLFHIGPRKRPSAIDPLVQHGRHFGRTIRTFCRIDDLLKRGVQRALIQAQCPEVVLSPEDLYEDGIYQQLVELRPGLDRRLLTASDQELAYVASMVLKGSSGARSDDTKSLKGVIIDWITPQGQRLNPPISHNIKTDRGFHHERTGELLCPIDFDWSNGRIKDQLRSGELIATGDHWPLFLYRDFSYNPEEPWRGLLRSNLLVLAYKHIFTSPSSVYQKPRATRLGNAKIHSMTSVTIPSVAYVATQVRFALSSNPIFSRNGIATEFERFYGSIIEFLEDSEEGEEAERLLTWWNRQIFHGNASNRGAVYKNCVVATIKEKRRTGSNLT